MIMEFFTFCATIVAADGKNDAITAFLPIDKNFCVCDTEIA
jgi:hypothetical protein